MHSCKSVKVVTDLSTQMHGSNWHMNCSCAFQLNKLRDLLKSTHINTQESIKEQLHGS